MSLRLLIVVIQLILYFIVYRLNFTFLMKLPYCILLVISLFCVNVLFGAVMEVPRDYSKIQEALDACSANDTVLVSKGIYFENIVWPNTNGIKLIGQSGSDSTFLVSGKMGRVITFIFVAVDTSTLIKGFTISNRLNNAGSFHGGGILLQNASAKLEDLKLQFNYLYSTHAYGAGVYAFNSDLVIRNCSINQNVLDSATWANGAGVYLQYGTLQISDSEIFRNTATSNSWCYGSGVYFDGHLARITGTKINANYGNANGGGWCFGVGVYASSNSSLDTPIIELNRVIIDSNYTGDGTERYYGIGAYVHGLVCSFKNVLISNNVMGVNSYWNAGAGIYYSSCDFKSYFKHVTVANNRKRDSTRIDGRGFLLNEVNVEIVNSISYNPGIGAEVLEINRRFNRLNISYSNIYGGHIGVGNINSDPLFISDSDFSLANNSFCADAGTSLSDVMVDINNNFRPQPINTNPDMGCYEISQEADGIYEFKSKENQISVFPNPVLRGRKLKVLGKNLLNIRIVNSLGLEMPFILDESSNSISTSSFRPGFYYVRYNESHFYSKFIVTE